MSPELHLTYRASRGEVIGGLFVAVFFAVIGCVAHWACFVNGPNNCHDVSILEKILAVAFIDGIFVFFVVFCIYATVYSHYYKLTFDENGITEHGIRSVKTIRISEITAIQ